MTDEELANSQARKDAEIEDIKRQAAKEGRLHIDERNDAIAVLERLHARLAKYALGAKIGQRRLEIVLIVVSGITSGSLWALLAGIAPHVTAWLGAILSTAVTLLTAYKQSLGPEHVYKRAAELYKETGELLAKMRSSNEFDKEAFWHGFKFIQANMVEIDWVRKGKEGDPILPA
jgi:hypothetical protein